MQPTGRSPYEYSPSETNADAVNQSSTRQKYTRHCPNSSSQRRIGIVVLAILLAAAVTSFILMCSQTPPMRFVSLSSVDTPSMSETIARVRSCNSFTNRGHSCRSVTGEGSSSQLVATALRDFSTSDLPSGVAWEVVASSSTVISDSAAVEDFCGQASSSQQIVASTPVEQNSPDSLNPSLLCIRQTPEAQQVVETVLATPGSDIASQFTNAIESNEQVRGAVQLVDPVSSRVNTRYGSDTGTFLRPGAAAQNGDPVVHCPPNDGQCLGALIDETTLDNHFS